MPRSFASRLVAWQKVRGRHDLPWQGTRDPYRIWLSEVMLQQTQVATVIPYYQRFVRRFPDVGALARASEDEVLALWSGLGYYARGRNLHRAARLIAKRGFPRTAEAIAELPGVGRSTAAAIAVFAYGERAAILDGNAKRVLARCFAVQEPNAIWPLAERLLPFPEIAQASWRVRSRRRLPIVEHGFTHFRLRATPILCAVGAARPAKNQRWIALSQAARAAVPTPVKKLLIGL